MPLGVLTRRQYDGFRTGSYPVRQQPVKIAFDPPWDLHMIKPAFFPMPASTVFGQREHHDGKALALREESRVMWRGRFNTDAASWEQAAAHVERTARGPISTPAARGSPYAGRFSQGATVVPRALFVVEPDDPGPLGAGRGRQAVRSRRRPLEKMPWRELPSLHGTIERQFIMPLYVGDSILPFRCLEPLQAVIPWDGEQLLHGGNERLGLYPGLAEWWRSAEVNWKGRRSSDRLSLAERLDYRRTLSQQFPTADHRVVYTASGMYLAAAIVSDRRAIIEHKLYWGRTTTLDEARYLTTILNSTTLTMAVRPLQARGEHNPRDFDKYVFQVPIPEYDPQDSAHKLLVKLAERAQQVSAGVSLMPIRFEALRRRVREALIEEGVAVDIDAVVETLLI